MDGNVKIATFGAENRINKPAACYQKPEYIERNAVFVASLQWLF